MNPHVSESSFACIIEMMFSPDSVTGSLEALQSVVGSTLAQTGCLDCTVCRNVTEPNCVRYSEIWDCEASFQQHISSEEFRRVLLTLDAAIREPAVMVGTLSGKGGMNYLQKLLEPHAEPFSPPWP